MRLKFEDLVRYFNDSCKPTTENGIGIEYELFCFEKRTGKRTGYFSSPGVREILFAIRDYTGGTAMMEGGNITGVKTPGFEISLEPGGQIEASFIACKRISEVEKLLSDYLHCLNLIEKDLGVCFTPLGVDNRSRLEEVEWMPKKRYEIMRKFLAKRGKLSHHMMKMTASIQINIDYHSEEDAMRKFSMGIQLHKMLSQLFLNSDRTDPPGKSLLNRTLIWEKTDPRRSAIPQFQGRSISSFEDYINYAIDIPMMFIHRKGEYRPLQHRLSFRKFMEGGLQGDFPTIHDWIMQLNSLFPVVRFNRTIIELRMFDSNTPRILHSIAAVIKGLFYFDPPEVLPLQPGPLLDIARKNLRTSGEDHYLSEIPSISIWPGEGSPEPIRTEATDLSGPD